MRREGVEIASIILAGAAACATPDANREPQTTGLSPSSSSAADPGSSAGGSVDATTTSDPTTGPADSTSATTGPPDCTFCNAPNQACIDNVCVTTCHGQTPDPCGPAEVCDVISGECHAPAAPCTLAGASITCGTTACGPGSTCDGAGTCVPIAPCGAVACLEDGAACWGTACECTRQSECASAPDETALNGPFSADIGDLEFADDCTAWMVTMRSGTDFVRRLTVDGVVTEWAGVSNLNMGEIAVLKALAPPAEIGAGESTRLAARPTSRSRPDAFAGRGQAGVEGLGEVAITYTCCPTCGCFVDPPQGVARLVEDDPLAPLPIVIVAVPTQGTGPFTHAAANAGPQGLTWGVDRVLYVGNSLADGELSSADLDSGAQGVLTNLGARVTAGVPVSPVHNLFATDDGALHLYNAQTLELTTILELGVGVTSLAHDAFSGVVYASLSDLRVVAIRPFSAQVQLFEMMPATGRVAVSPDGQLWYVPMRFLAPDPIARWDLPDTL